MAALLDNRGSIRLGRLCDPVADAGILSAPTFPGIDRMEARFFGNGFEPHRHDTYAIGITLHGVQTFTYRGTTHYSTPGNLIVLHPDELHDGGAATTAGLRYRMLYLEPSVMRKGFGRDWWGLPFVDNPVIADQSLQKTVLSALADIDEELDDLLADQLVMELAEGLCRHSGQKYRRGSPPAHRQVKLAREYLDAHMLQTVRSGDLEAASGMDRFALARQFRMLFGTSPHRYLIMRRLHAARTMIETGSPLSEAALEAGFADQSHFNRHFKNAYGMTPGRWRRMTAGSRNTAK